MAFAVRRVHVYIALEKNAKSRAWCQRNHIAAKLMELGQNDFAAMRKALHEIRSGDAAKLVDGLAAITGESPENIRTALRNLTQKQREEFAASLAKVAGADGKALKAALDVFKIDEEDA